MNGKIECKWGRNSPFTREVIGDFILKKHPEYKNQLEEKVDEWLDSFESSMDFVDFIHYRHFRSFFETYFQDLGCNKTNVLPYITEFWHSFPNYGDALYKAYITMGGICKDCEGMYLPERIWFYHEYSSKNPFHFSTFYFDKHAPLEEIANFNYEKAIEIIEKFDIEFDWISKYSFKPKWLSAFCTIVDFIYSVGNTENNVVKKYCETARAFLEKYS